MGNLARTLFIFIARKLNISPLVAQILFFSPMYLVWSANEGGFFDPVNFVLFWGGTSLVLVLSILLNGWDWVKKDFKDRY